MSQLFDLNVSNYSLRELLNFFGVDKNDDGASVDRSCNDLKKKIQADPKLGPVTKGKIHDFLNKAVGRLSQSRNTTTELFESGSGGNSSGGNSSGNSSGGNSSGNSSGSGSDGITAATITAAIKASAPAPGPTKFMQLKNDVEQHGDSFLITRPSEQAGIAGNFKNGKTALTGAPPGILNPLAIATIKRALNVDTRFRSNYYSTRSTDFVFNIPYKFENVTSMSVATYELPLTYYAISQQYENNCIIFQWKDPGVLNYDNQYTLLIPDGNYNASFQSGNGSPIESAINGILKGTSLVSETGLAYTVDRTSGRSIFSCNSATDASGNVFPYSPALTTTVFMTANTSTTPPPIDTLPNGQIVWGNVVQAFSTTVYFSMNDNAGAPIDLSAYTSSTLTITDGTNVQTFTVSNVEDDFYCWTMTVSGGAGPNMGPGASIQATFTTVPVHTPFTGSMRIVFNARAGIDRNAESSVNVSTSNTSFQSDTRPLPYFLGWQLGYRTAIYQLGGGEDSTGSTSPGIPQSAVSEGICLITGPQYVFLCIDDYNNNVNNYYASAYGSSTIAPNIIARLNIKQQINSAGAYGVVSGESLSTSLTYSREYFGPVDIQRIRITLVDDFGRVLDLNNMDWSFALMFECVYSSSMA
jgi:hypothetical protein